MKLKYIKGTTRGNYNPQYILELIKDNELDKDDTTRILEETTYIIVASHKKFITLIEQINNLEKSMHDLMSQLSSHTQKNENKK